MYVLNIELRDAKIHAIEFVLKDGSCDRWLVFLGTFLLPSLLLYSTSDTVCKIHVSMLSRLKLNHGNFRVEIPEKDDPSAFLPPIPNHLIEHKAYLIWESKGRPSSSPEQQKVIMLILLDHTSLHYSSGLYVARNPHNLVLIYCCVCIGSARLQ